MRALAQPPGWSDVSPPLWYSARCPIRSYVKMMSSADSCCPSWKKTLSLTVKFQVTSSGSSHVNRFAAGFPLLGSTFTHRSNTPWEFW